MGILQMSIWASVLIAAVVIIRSLTLHKLPKKTFLALWGVVLCRLLLPFSIPSRLSFHTGINAMKHALGEKAALSAPVEMTFIPNMTDFAGMGAPLEIAPTASVLPIELVWLIGVCVWALFFIVAYIRGLREFKTSLPVSNDFAERWLREHSLKRPVQIRQSDRVKAPLTYGVFRPVILLPRQTDWTDETRLRYILTHELTHIRRFDTMTKLVLTAAVCLHWFNPLVWVMYVLANRDIELSCDESVIRAFGETTKSAYALTLIGLEEKKSRLTPLVNSFSKNAVKERINAIMKMKRISLMGIVLALILVLGITTVFATSAANPAKDDGQADSPAVLSQIPGGNETKPSIPAPKETQNVIPTPAPDDTLDVAPSPAPGETQDIIPTPTPQNGASKNNTAAKEPASEDNGHTSPQPAPKNQDTSTQEPVPINRDPDAYESYYFDFPKNKNGETYGSSKDCAPGQRDPDLIAAERNGQFGYIRYDEIPGMNVTTLEEAEEYVAYMKTLPSVLIFNLYDQEGNVIGEFETSNSYGDGGRNEKRYASLEEAREAIANGDY